MKLVSEEVRIKQLQSLPNIEFLRFDGQFIGVKTKAIVRCLIDNNEWSTRIDHLLTNHKCALCAGNYRFSGDERIKQINAMNGIRFIKWYDGSYRDKDSKVLVSCELGHEWVTKVGLLVHGGHGCRVCYAETASTRQRMPAEERIAQINEIDGVWFARWELGHYRNNRSKAVCYCDSGHEWVASVHALLKGLTGCPQCAKTGYKKSRLGTLYALRSDCGVMVKIGISNDYKRRLRELKSATPFDWSCIELIHSDDGAFIAKAEKELHKLTEQAQFSEPFDGYTEWRKWDDRLPMWIEQYRVRA